MAQTLPCSNSVVHHAHSRMQRRPAPPASGSALLHTPAKPLRASSAKKLAKSQGAARLRQCTLIRAGQAIADPPSTSSQSAAVDEGALLDCVVVGGGISGLVTAQVTACFPQKHVLRVSVRNMVLQSFKRFASRYHQLCDVPCRLHILHSEAPPAFEVVSRGTTASATAAAAWPSL